MLQSHFYPAGLAVYITLNRMKRSKDARRAWLVAACFGGFIGISLAASYLLGLLPTTEGKCTSQCEMRELEGHMVHIFPAAMTAGMRGRGAAECRCFRLGTYNSTTQ